ncbi:MAG TPA: hypothetical protein PLH64_03370 [Anaerolineaceae bacterium]|nr:hypothetical protein [Anaerolineaceae bacterium]
MKPNFGKFFVLVLLITFLLASSASQTRAQTPAPPGIMENDEIPKDHNFDHAISDRRLATVDGGKNSINAANTYWSTSGYSFVPGASTITYFYGAAGCVDTGADYDVWRESVNVPHGSTIVGMWFNYNNEIVDPPDSEIYLMRYGYWGSYEMLLHVAGTHPETGAHTESTYTVINALVDNNNYSYFLVWDGKMQQELCGVNLEYTPPPIFFNALPMINR